MRARRLLVLLGVVAVAGCSSVVQGNGHGSLAPPSTVPTTPAFPSSSTAPVSSPPISFPPISFPPITSAAPPASPFPRAAVSTAIGDPPTADLCAAIGLNAMRGLGYTPSFSDRTIPPGCLIHMYRSGRLSFNVGVYGDRPGTQASNPKRSTRKESGLTVYVYPFTKAFEGNCERDIAAAGATLHVYALSVTTAGRGDRAAHCAAADALTRKLAAAVAGGSVPRLQLADPSLSSLDFCAALRQTHISDLPGFAGTPQPDGISAGCSVLKSHLDIYFEFQLETALIPQATSALTVGGHHVYASDGNITSACTFYSVQARTSGGRYERVSVYADAFGKHNPPHLCASTATALGRYLDTLGLR